MLVEYQPTPTLLEFVRLQRYLSELPDVPVDLVMKSALRPKIGQRILEEVVPVWPSYLPYPHAHNPATYAADPSRSQPSSWSTSFNCPLDPMGNKSAVGARSLAEIRE